MVWSRVENTINAKGADAYNVRLSCSHSPIGMKIRYNRRLILFAKHASVALPLAAGNKCTVLVGYEGVCCVLKF